MHNTSEPKTEFIFDDGEATAIKLFPDRVPAKTKSQNYHIDKITQLIDLKAGRFIIPIGMCKVTVNEIESSYRETQFVNISIDETLNSGGLISRVAVTEIN